MVEEAADDAAASVADDLPEELRKIPSKEQREKLYKQCALLLNMHKPNFKKRNRQPAVQGNQWHIINDAWGAYNHRVHVVEGGGPTVLSVPTLQHNNFINRLM